MARRFDSGMGNCIKDTPVYERGLELKVPHITAPLVLPLVSPIHAS